MTYRDLLYKATRLCDKGEITLGEYEEMTKPLDREIEQEPFINKPCVSSGVCEHDKNKVLEKIRAEIGKAWCIKPKNRYEEGLKDQALKDMQTIDRYKAENEVEDGNDD